MSKCPINDFKECLGQNCEWYITDRGLCSFALIATSSEELTKIRVLLEHPKDSHKN